MARPESIAVGGYYKTPVGVVEQIAAWFAPLEPRTARYVFVDPCAGDGEALGLLADGVVSRLTGEPTSRYGLPRFMAYGCELEAGRYDGRRALPWPDYHGDLQGFLHGDAFLAEWDKPAADVLYLNPPYDTDRVAGRLEQRFLERFTDILRPGAGWLVFVVPHYALETSAVWLATHFDDLDCRRFPDGEYEAFRQVVLVGRRRTSARLFAADSPEAARVRRWAAEPQTLAVLGEAAGRLALTPDGGYGLAWRMGEIDVLGLQAVARPLMEGKVGSLTPARGLGLDADLSDLIAQRFPVVMPPRPAHVAIALAAGLVNGHAVAPDDTAAGWPSLMIKGVFTREFKVIEEKVNKDGHVTSQTAIQQPKLTVSILDMTTWTYHDLAEGAEPSGAAAVADFNIADLLTHYGLSLARLMHEQCPPLHDPADPAAVASLPPLALPLFAYQRHAATAALRVILADAPPFAGEHPFILGEVGTGKTAVAFAVAASLMPGAIDRLGLPGRRPRPVRRMLVMCPPHLTASWATEAAKFLPGARVVILERTTDVDRAASLSDAPPTGLPGSGLTLLLLSREMAKLGHGWVDGRRRGRCPTCGAFVAGSVETMIRNRTRCDHRERRPANEAARWAERLARALAPAVSGLDAGYAVLHLLRGAVLRQAADGASRAYDGLTAAEAETERDTVWEDRAAVVRELAEAAYAAVMTRAVAGEWREASGLTELLRAALRAAVWPGRDERIAAMALDIARQTARETASYTGADDLRGDALRLLLLMTGGRTGQAATLEGMQALDGRLEWRKALRQINRLHGQRTDNPVAPVAGDYFSDDYEWADGRLWYSRGYGDEARRVPVGGYRAGLLLLEKVLEGATWANGPVCDTPLYGASPAPRRYPLATYIARKHPDLFDLLVLDEAHEYSTDGSAQERAAHRLTEIGRPTLVLTGTSNNGYASSLFMNMWALSRRFRAEFGRDQLEQFVNRYGYRKVRIDPDEDDLKAYDHYGAMSDRVDTGTATKMRKIGQAPGVLPLFILRHMLPSAVLLQKADMDEELPPLVEIEQTVTPDDGLLRQYLSLRDDLMAQIMDDLRNSRDLAGLLWGQMAQMPTYLDRAHADTGNADTSTGRRYEIGYPASVGGGLVAAAKPLTEDEIVAKEAWLLERLAAEEAAGRHSIVFVVNTNSGLAARVTRLVNDHLGRGAAVFLNAGKVKASARMDWIDREVVKRRRKVLVVNPEAVETGLNNLVYFATAIWFQNPNCSSITYTQANGRIHRPGQTADEVRVYVPYYVGTSQEAQFMLLGHKVAASRQADGLDVTSALMAAGAAQGDGIDAMSLGQAIYRLLSEGGLRGGNGATFTPATPRPRPELPAPRPHPAPTGPANQLPLFG